MFGLKLYIKNTPCKLIRKNVSLQLRPFSISSLDVLNGAGKAWKTEDFGYKQMNEYLSEQFKVEAQRFRSLRYKQQQRIEKWKAQFSTVQAKPAPNPRTLGTEEELEQALNKYASKQATPLCLDNLIALNKTSSQEEILLRASVFLHHELKIRLAKRAAELENLPYDSSTLPAIQEVRSWYINSFKDVYKFPQPKNTQMERRFTALVKEIYERHSGTLWTMARGFYQLKQKHRESLNGFNGNGKGFWLGEEYADLQRFLDDFFMSRIGIRVLIGQHVALHEHIEGWAGLICLKTSPLEISRAAVASASKACVQRYGVAPIVNVSVANESDGFCFPYIPSHLHHILFELLKNSMKATIECNEGHSDLPKIDINISRDEDRIVKIIIRDQGGGIKPENLQKIWSYMFTTATLSDSEELFEYLENRGRDFVYEGGMPIAGLGYGLPISRLFAKYLGGDIEINNIPGGVEAEITLKPLLQSVEPIQ